MGLLLLEALGALALFVFIIWWTMFSGRKGGERRLPEQDEQEKEVGRPDQSFGGRKKLRGCSRKRCQIERRSKAWSAS